MHCTSWVCSALAGYWLNCYNDEQRIQQKCQHEGLHVRCVFEFSNSRVSFFDIFDIFPVLTLSSLRFRTMLQVVLLGLALVDVFVHSVEINLVNPAITSSTLLAADYGIDGPSTTDEQEMACMSFLEVGEISCGPGPTILRSSDYFLQ